MISTSTIRISVVVAAADLERAARRAAHRVRSRRRPGLLRRRCPNASDRRLRTSTATLVSTRLRRWHNRSMAAAAAHPVEDGGDASRGQTLAPTTSSARPAGCSTTRPATTLTLAEFVATGDNEVAGVPRGVRAAHARRRRADARRDRLRHRPHDGASPATFGTVVACDLDAGFLERCRETVAQFGKVDRLRTVHVADGRTLDVARRRRRPRVQLHHAPALRPTTTPSPRRRGGAGRPAGRPRRPQLPHVGRRRRRPAGRPGKLVRGLFRVPRFGPLAVAQAPRRRPARLAGQPARPRPGRSRSIAPSSSPTSRSWRSPDAATVHGHRRRPTTRSKASTRSHWWLVASVLVRRSPGRTSRGPGIPARTGAR